MFTSYLCAVNEMNVVRQNALLVYYSLKIQESSEGWIGGTENSLKIVRCFRVKAKEILVDRVEGRGESPGKTGIGTSQSGLGTTW